MARISRKTKQKGIIDGEIAKYTTFFTVKDLHRKILRKDGNIGIATVYRFLKDLSERNKLHIYNCDRTNIYSVNKSNHCHFVCQQCKTVTHFAVNNLDFMKNAKGNVSSFEIIVNGICETCQRD